MLTGGGGKKDPLLSLASKNMNKALGGCRLGWIQMDMQKNGPFPS